MFSIAPELVSVFRCFSIGFIADHTAFRTRFFSSDLSFLNRLLATFGPKAIGKRWCVYLLFAFWSKVTRRRVAGSRRTAPTYITIVFFIVLYRRVATAVVLFFSVKIKSLALSCFRKFYYVSLPITMCVTPFRSAALSTLMTWVLPEMRTQRIAQICVGFKIKQEIEFLSMFWSHDSKMRVTENVTCILMHSTRD